MKICPKCGAELEDKVRFCGYCGEKQQEVSRFSYSEDNAPNNTFDSRNDQNSSGSGYYGQTSSQGRSGTYGGTGSGDFRSSSTEDGSYSSGSSYGSSTGSSYSGGTGDGGYGSSYGNSHGYGGSTPRSIPLCVILSIITCGIYGIYWMVKLNDEINALAGNPNGTSGGMVVLFTFLTCGIYGIYWNYRMGEECDEIKRQNNSTGILFLVLSLVGFSIVNFCLMQDTLNKY